MLPSVLSSLFINFRFDDRDYVPVFNEASLFYKNYIYLLFTNYDKPVDTFFLIGGLLITMSLLHALDKCEQSKPRYMLEF